MTIALGDARALARSLVAIDSRNPALVPGAPGEGAVARLLAGVLDGWGFRVHVDDVVPGRPNVVARIGQGRGRTLMFNGHLDVVGVDGMTHAPFDPVEREGRLYGRGACDMKAGIAAMCAAAARAAAGGLAGEIVIAAVIDEEHESLGTRHLIASGVRTDAAVVTEPTGLAVMPAHKGFAWIEVTVHGRAAHGSRWELGIDAIRHAGLLLAELDDFDATELAGREHPLLGRASLHASLIEGGSGLSTYPDRCVIQLERRTLPGERAQDAVREIEAACARVRARRADFRADVALSFAQQPSDVSPADPIVRALADASDGAAAVRGMSAWTDCALLNEAAIPSVCFGPGDIAMAHAPEESVALLEIDRAAATLERLARAWCTAPA